MQSSQNLNWYPDLKPMLTEQAAQDYINEMLHELCLIAQDSNLQETACLLNMTRLIMKLKVT